ncbi:MAG: acetyl/propionyl-CoA carboxylase alpha subunit/acetyl-CoA carboxylase alpha subunit [Gammaproteobacteria bacterium]
MLRQQINNTANEEHSMVTASTSIFSSSSTGADPLFLQAEQTSAGFSLFPDEDPVPLSVHLQGLVEERRIETRLEAIRKLSVDEYIEQTVLPAQHSKRPSAKAIVAALNGNIISSKEQGPFYSAEVELVNSRGNRRICFICQERTSANGSWLPEHHEMARQAIRLYSDMSRPIVFLIDTPGADASEVANSQNQAHSISRLITESANVDVPTVGIIIGVGFSGGAIPLAAANVLLSVRDGIFNTIQPQGLQSIARKFNLSWQECAKAVGVSPEELYTLGCIDGIIDYSPVDQDERQHNLQKAIFSSIEAIENASVEFVRNSVELREHYDRHLARRLSPGKHEKVMVSSSTLGYDLDLGLGRTPTTQSNIFGLCYRYLRYLSVRGRVHSISSSEYGRLSKLTLPEGDLDSRLSLEKDSVFKNWLNDPDKVIYDDQLAKVWKNFNNKREDLNNERNAVTRLLLGEPKEKYEQAVTSLTFEIGFLLYNRWKSSATHNFRALIALLEDEETLPLTENWPPLNTLNVMDVVTHKELRALFIQQCQDLLIFDTLYDNVVVNLASIAKEAMETQSLSRASVGTLLHSSLGVVLGSDSDTQKEDRFEKWMKFFLNQGHLGELLTKVEQWKSIGNPQMNDSLFVILTYYIERLLPAYYKSKGEGDFKGTINPARIGRRKDFWNRLTMGYQDLLILKVLRGEKPTNKVPPEEMIGRFFKDFYELGADKTSPNPVNFPGFRQSIEQALENDIRPCGLVTGLATLKSASGDERRVGVAVSNMLFQAGAFDMASGEKFCHLLVECAKKHLPVVCFISSGGMQTKEGASALFSMAVVNDRITRFIRDNELPVIMFGYGDCTGGAQASFVTHPLVQTYYFSGTNMPFAGQMVVPSYLPSTSTLSNYLSKTPGSMAELVKHPFSETLDFKLKEIDSTMPMATKTVEEVIEGALSSVMPVLASESEALVEIDPRSLMSPIKQVLVHARGCTAVKLIRKAHEANLSVVLVASDPDMTSVPAKMLRGQDKLICLGGNTSDESYLNAQSVLKVAQHEQVPSLHPGIGFLSENPHFASLCVNNGINFIGPSSNSMMTMGNKSNAIQTVQANNVPVVPGSHGILASCEQAINIANNIGYPVLLKAVHGGGGKGIQVVRNQEEMLRYYGSVSAEARAAFGNGDLYLEKFVTSMRHIEVQLLRDSHGNSRVIGLRDCSVQRNNQKMIEESASTLLPEDLKEKVFEYTLAIADAVDYTGAGTVEFIYNLDAGEIYFMEMNTRLQVEHPVTEATSGVDIVKTQFEIAGGGSIEKIERNEQGYAIEVRVTAEKIVLDSEGVMQLSPNPGLVTRCEIPEHDDVEIIAIVDEGIEISPFYDSLIAQIIMRGDNREDVIEKLFHYLDTVVIEGIATNITLLKRILMDKTFQGGDYDTNYLPGFMASLDAGLLIEETNAASSSGVESDIDFEAIKVAGSNELKVCAASSGVFYTAAAPSDPDFVAQGDIVDVNQSLALMEAMKMFSQISLNSFNSGDNVLYPADKKYRIERVNNSNGQLVSKGDLLFIVSVVE